MLLGGIAAASALIAVVCCVCAGAFGTLSWLWMLPVVFAGAYAVLFLIAFGFLWFVCKRVDVSVPQEHDSKFYRAVMYLYIRALMSLVLVRVHTQGLENTPKEGRFLLVCNHQHIADPGILLWFFRKSQLAFISKQENMGLPIINKFMHKIMCQMLDRDDDRQALKVILKCIQLIKDDEVSIGVFPEGYTSKDGKLHHFRSGVFKIAQKANVPIVVCTVQNTRMIFRNLARLKHTDVQLHLVGVIPAEALKGKSAVEIGECVHKMMADDLGPDLVAEE